MRATVCVNALARCWVFRETNDEDGSEGAVRPNIDTINPTDACARSAASLFLESSPDGVMDLHVSHSKESLANPSRLPELETERGLGPA